MPLEEDGTVLAIEQTKDHSTVQKPEKMLKHHSILCLYRGTKFRYHSIHIFLWKPSSINNYTLDVSLKMLPTHVPHRLSYKEGSWKSLVDSDNTLHFKHSHVLICQELPHTSVLFTAIINLMVSHL